MCLGHSCAANDALKWRKPYRDHLVAAAVASGTQASTGDRKRLVACSGDPETRVAAETSREPALCQDYQWLGPVYLPSFPATQQTVPYPSPPKFLFCLI